MPVIEEGNGLCKKGKSGPRRSYSRSGLLKGTATFKFLIITFFREPTSPLLCPNFMNMAFPVLYASISESSMFSTIPPSTDSMAIAERYVS